LKEKSIIEEFKIDEKKIFFIGHSMGGFAALYNSIFLDDVKNICAIAPFNAGYFGKFLKANPSIKSYSIEKMLSSMDFVNCNSPESLLDEMIGHSDKWDLINYIDKLKEKNLLIIGSKYDTTAPLEIHHLPFVKKLEEQITKFKIQNSTFKIEVLDTGHSFSDKRIQLMRLISEWANQIKF
jgi:pimeloyl-ACP methyl ester carboxylesterase